MVRTIASMPKFLIITADDFGLHQAVNDAVEQACRDGVLRAASLMVGAPAAADAIRRAKSLPGLRIGLHLVLVDGKAVLPYEAIPSLTDQHGFMDAHMLEKSIRAFALPGVRRQVAAEIRAQFEAFARSGLALDHVNLHKHFHLHPTLLDMVIRIGRDYGLRAIRLPDEPRWFAADPNGRAAIGNILLKPWLARMRYRLERAQLFHNDALFGIAHSGAMVEARLLQVIARLPEGISEVYLHPAATASPITSSMQGYRHAAELAALMSARVRAAIAASGVAVGGFEDARRSIET
jgi:hopanoid biosynthesis associated protein HpnK